MRIGGVRIIAADRAGLAQMMVEEWQQNKASGYKKLPKLFFSANGQSVAYYGWNREFKKTLDSADFVHADGMWPVLMSRIFLETALPERVATTDFFHDVALEAEVSGMRFYLFGASEEVNAAAAEEVKRLYPKLRIAGRRNGYFQPSQEMEIVEEIRAARTDVLWVALGRPKQEQFCIRNREHLRGVTWVKTCGGLFDFLSGEASRAPMWMQHAGLEWLYRTAQEPRRLFWRYLTTNPYALWRMLMYTGELDDQTSQPAKADEDRR